MWLCTANMLIKLEFVWLPSTPEGQLLWTTQVAVQMSCPSWSKRMESRKQIQNDPNAPNATVSYSNSRPHWEDIGFAFWHVVAGPLRQIRTTLPTYTPILLKTLIRTWPSKGLCLPRPPPLTFLSDSGNGSRSQWTTATNCWKAPPAAPVLPASFKRPRALCAPYGSVVLPRPLGRWKCRCSPELWQRVYAISGMGCNMVSSIFFRMTWQVSMASSWSVYLPSWENNNPMLIRLYMCCHLLFFADKDRCHFLYAAVFERFCTPDDCFDSNNFR